MPLAAAFTSFFAKEASGAFTSRVEIVAFNPAFTFAANALRHLGCFNMFSEAATKDPTSFDFVFFLSVVDVLVIYTATSVYYYYSTYFFYTFFPGG